MYLEEFALDLPYLVDEERVNKIMEEKEYSRDEAISLDYDTNWKDKRQVFRLETRCIASMFARLFERMKTKDCWKILIECVRDINEDRIVNYLGVLTIQIKFDYNDFVSKSDYEKKQKALELIIEGCKLVAENEGWDLEPFKTVYSKIVREDYRNEWIWKKPIKSKDKKNSAELICCHDVKCVDIYIVLRDKKGLELARKKVISELPDEFAYARHLGKLEWVSSSEVSLINKDGDKIWNINFKQ